MRQTINTNLDAEVKTLLEGRQSDWAVIAEKAGVSHSWIFKFVKYGIENPGYRTLLRIHKAVKDTRPGAATTKAAHSADKPKSH